MALYVGTANGHGEADDENGDGYLHLLNFDVAAVDDNNGGLSKNTTEESIQWSTTAQPSATALELQEVENVDWTQISVKSNGGVIGSKDDGYLHIINFDVAAVVDNDGGLSNNATEEICCSSSLQRQEEDPDQQSTITIAATIKEWCPGRVFNPAEEEIAGFYLKLAAMGMPLPPFAESAVRRVDVYGNQALWEVFAEELGRGSRVFFAITRLVKCSKGRMSRVVGGGGTWKGQSVKREVKIGDVTAVRYSLSFMKETNDEQAAASPEKTKKKKKMASTHWNMVKYKVLSYSSEGDLDQNVVFCRLTYSGPQHQSSPVPSSASSSAVGGSKRGRREGDESISSRPCKRVTQEQQQDDGVTTYSALNHQAGESSRRE
uniref:NAC domain-containing protein n=1 Tax=Kalanchoe fedtschenkoi TaxID=63787 RepID=A0A7N0TZA0_KALFE